MCGNDNGAFSGLFRRFGVGPKWRRTSAREARNVKIPLGSGQTSAISSPGVSRTPAVTIPPPAAIIADVPTASRLPLRPATSARITGTPNRRASSTSTARVSSATCARLCGRALLLGSPESTPRARPGPPPVRSGWSRCRSVPRTAAPRLKTQDFRLPPHTPTPAAPDAAWVNASHHAVREDGRRVEQAAILHTLREPDDRGHGPARQRTQDRFQPLDRQRDARRLRVVVASPPTTASGQQRRSTPSASQMRTRCAISAIAASRSSCGSGAWYAASFMAFPSGPRSTPKPVASGNPVAFRAGAAPKPLI